jgi:hypothetical protein
LERAELAENISFILYLIPLVASVVYALTAWVTNGLSSALPITVYLTVTKDPYLFLIGFAAICSAVLVEIIGSPSATRIAKLISNIKQIQILAIVCVLSSLVSVWSATDYSPSIGRLLDVLLEGRYALIFPLMLFILAFLLSPSIRLSSLSAGRLLRNSSIALLIITPLTFYGLWRLHLPWIAILTPTLVLLLTGFALLVYNSINRQE